MGGKRFLTFEKKGVNGTTPAIKRAEMIFADLKIFRTRIYKEFSTPIELFEPNHKLDIESRKEKIRKLKFFNQTSMAHSLLLRHELRLKLLTVLDGYIIAVDQKNLVLVYLSARYILELLAIVNYLTRELKEAKKVGLKDWQGRGQQFLSGLCRGRYASSDPKIADVLKAVSVSRSAITPVNMTKAIAVLAESENFETAISDYSFLSNICHHNGSSHQLFHRSMRQTNSVRLPSGDLIVRTSAGPAITLEYPATVGIKASVVQTAHLVFACGTWIEELLKDFPLTPFSDEDFSQLTGGAYSNATNYFPYRNLLDNGGSTLKNIKRVGRNDLCACGSGIKFKKCCDRLVR